MSLTYLKVEKTKHENFHFVQHSIFSLPSPRITQKLYRVCKYFTYYMTTLLQEIFLFGLEWYTSYVWRATAMKQSSTMPYICYVQTVDWDNPWIALHKPWIHALHNNPWIVCANCGSTLRATQSQAPQTKGTGCNRREGLRSATQGDVWDSYLELEILHCSLWGLG